MLRSMRVVVVALLWAAVVVGCSGPKIEVNGIQVYERHWNKTLEELKPRVEFELGCPAHQVEFHLFKRTQRTPTEVGVTGCGKRGMYVRTVVDTRVGPWVLNSESSPAVR
jgi:hypothetical protein